MIVSLWSESIVDDVFCNNQPRFNLISSPKKKNQSSSSQEEENYVSMMVMMASIDVLGLIQTLGRMLLGLNL
jgi:hypothetical protein